MITRRQILIIFLGLVVSITISVNAVAQSALSTGISSVNLTLNLSSSIQSYRQIEQPLAQEYQQLVQEGATEDEILAWQQQNSATIGALQQAALNLALATPAEPLAYVTEVVVPEDATQNLTDLLMTQADLFNRFVQVHNQHLLSGSVPANEAMTFSQGNAAEIQTSQQLAIAVAAEADQQVQATPPPLQIPSGASPQLQNYLTLRDTITRALIQIHNQNINSTPAARQAALLQWQDQNASLLLQMQQAAQSLAQGASQ